MSLLRAFALAAGIVIAILAVLMARKGRLSTGYGAAWFLAGLILAVIGIVWEPLAAVLGLSGTGATSGTALALVLIIWLVGMEINHSIAITALTERWRQVAREVALQRPTPEDGHADAEPKTR